MNRKQPERQRGSAAHLSSPPRQLTAGAPVLDSDLLPEGARHGSQLAGVAVGAVVAAADRIVHRLAQLLAFAHGLLVLHDAGGSKRALHAQARAGRAEICNREGGGVGQAGQESRAFKRGAKQLFCYAGAPNRQEDAQSPLCKPSNCADTTAGICPPPPIIGTIQI